MELSLIELSVLCYIKKKNPKKHRKPVKTAKIVKKFGDYSVDILRSLSADGYISGRQSVTNDGILHIINLCGDDDWEITNKGEIYIANNKLKIELANAERVKNQLLGFISGVLTASLAQYFAYLLNHRR